MPRPLPHDLGPRLPQMFLLSGSDDAAVRHAGEQAGAGGTGSLVVVPRLTVLAAKALHNKLAASLDAVQQQLQVSCWRGRAWGRRMGPGGDHGFISAGAWDKMDEAGWGGNRCGAWRGRKKGAAAGRSGQDAAHKNLPPFPQTLLPPVDALLRRRKDSGCLSSSGRRRRARRCWPSRPHCSRR